MKTIKFRPHLIDQILKGEKRSTFRLFDDKGLQVGDIVAFFNWETGEQFATAEITKAWEKPFGTLDDSDFEGHSPYNSVEEMVQKFKGYYGDKVTVNTVAKIIQFKLV